MSADTELNPSVPISSWQAGNQTALQEDIAVRCPHCGSLQFFGRRKVTPTGWLLYMAALGNLFLSFLLMFVLVGFLTIFLSPVLAIVGFYGCRRHVNTCARCKRDF